MPKRRPRKVPSTASGSAAPVSCASGLRVLPFDHTWQPGGGQVRHKWGTLAALSDSRNAQLSQKRRSLPDLYEAQTCGTRCYGPRLVKAHSTSDAARLAAVFTGLLLLASVPVALAAGATGPQSAGRGPAGAFRLAGGARGGGDPRAVLARGAARPGAQRARGDRRPPRGAGTRAGFRPDAADRRETGAADISESSSRTWPARSTSSPAAIRSPCCSAPGRSTRPLPASTESPGRRARTTGSSSRRARRGHGSSGSSARLAERDAELDGLAAAAEARAASLEATAAERRELHRRAATAAGSERGADRNDRGSGTDGRDTDDRPCGRLAAARRCRLSKSTAPIVTPVRGAHAHRQRDGLHDPRPDVDRDSDGAGRRRRRPGGDPARNATDDPGLRHRHRRRHRRRGAREHDRRLVRRRPRRRASGAAGPSPSRSTT